MVAKQDNNPQGERGRGGEEENYNGYKKRALVWGMPAAAIATGCVDWILPLDTIGAAMTNLVMHGDSHLLP